MEKLGGSCYNSIVMRGIPGYTGVYRRVLGYTGVYGGILGYAGVYWGISRCTGVYRGILWYILKLEEQVMNKVSIWHRIINMIVIIAICTGLFAVLPTKAQSYGEYLEQINYGEYLDQFNYNEYLDQFNFYVENARAGGLIPASVQGNLDETMSGRDLIDFIFQFSKVKCGIDTDSFLSRARNVSSSEDEAMITAINEMFSDNVWDVNEDGPLRGKVKLPTIFGTFQLAAYKQIASFSPLLYYLNNPLPVLQRYNFWNLPYVVYHDGTLVGLMSEIIGLSKGLQSTSLSIDDYVTRRQFAAYCYMFSTMSVPRDMNGKYPGGISGDRAVDDFIAGILDKAVEPGMTDNQKVKAIYDYLIYNFRHEYDNKTAILGSFDISINPLDDAIRISEPIISNGKGTCDSFANVFRLLAIRLGYECNYVSGYYVNSNGTRSGHSWNQIKVNGEWFWIDVDVEGQVFHRGSASAPSYFLFMKKDSYWTSNHDWDRSDWPAVDGTKYPLEFSHLDETTLPLSPAQPVRPTTPDQPTAPQPQSPSEIATTQLTAAPTASSVLVNGEATFFEAYNINEFNYFKLRDLANVLSGTPKQFEVGWDNTNNSIALTSGKAYTTVGGEMSAKISGMKTATPTTSRIILDGNEVTFTAYNIDGNNYFKLRDIGEAFNFGVDWDGNRNTVIIDTSKVYSLDGGTTTIM